MSTTVVGCFDDRSDAAAVQQELISAGIDRNNVRMTASGSTGTTQRDEPGFWESIKEAFGFADDDDRATYGEAARRGGIIMSVESPDASAERVVEIMRRHNAVDLDSRAAQWRSEGWTGYAAGAQGNARADESIASVRATQQAQPMAATTQQSQGAEAIPVVEEQLRVGKRAVQNGGVRVYSRVTETPVEEQVNLREERVSVERRPVDRPIGDADRAFQERSIEATEMAEEAVVAKEARVVEEIVVNKDIDQRTETVRDTVRRTDVDVESLPGQRAGDRTTSTAGMSYDDFTTELVSDERYRGRDWDAMESDVQTSFQQRYPQGRWDDSRDVIRQGYERMRQKNRS